MDDSKTKKGNPNSGPPVFVKYIGLAFQLFSIIGAGTYLGWWLDQRSGIKFPVWILVCCFLAVFVAFYQLWVQMKQDK
jgi:hypothetical protein